MTGSLDEHAANLRAALLALPPSGAAGFEGLLAAVLTEISGVPFRLAGSGSQFGLDGKAAYETDGVCFEGKRYDGDIPRSEVLTKIADLSIRDTDYTDLWVLGATTEVKTQLVDEVRALARKDGVAVLILDWTETGLPPLAVALAMARTAAAKFLEDRLSDRALRDKGIAALTAVAESRDFAASAARILAEVKEPTVGIGIAGRANIDWLTGVFSSRKQARRFLGQPLSPGERPAGELAGREALAGKLKPFLTGKPDGNIAAVLGEEGNGKSWLLAQAWLTLPDRPPMVFFTADDFSETSPPDDLCKKLIGKLIAQTGGQTSEGAIARWDRRFARWRKEKAPDAPRLVVVIDGLNQRPNIDWARLAEGIGSELDQIGGRLIVTARTTYYNNHVKKRLYTRTPEIRIGELSEEERDKILSARGIRGSDLRGPVAASLRNPRLLGIALELLQSARIVELEELNVSRLLFEYMRINERDAPSPRPASEFARKLQDHAREVLRRMQSQQRDDLKIFENDLEVVSGGRFFRPVQGDPARYTLDEDGLTLALAFAILDDLLKADRNGRDLGDALQAIIEPIDALDRTADVILAALTVACLEEDYPAKVGATVLKAFAKLQNPNTDEVPAFASLAVKRPEAFMQAAHHLCLAGGHQPNFDWIEAALHNAKADAGAWGVMSEGLHPWLSYYSLAPERRMFAHPSRDPAEKVEAERAKKQVELDAKLAALSPPERDVLNSLARRDGGDLSQLARFALTLIAGKPLAQFAKALAHWSFANALNSDHMAPYKEFAHLVYLNRADWPEAREAILKEAGFLDVAAVSHTGKWALVNLLRATGDPNDAAKALPLVAELTADMPRLEGWRLVEKYCAADPCDPDSARPENVEATAAQYAAIDVSEIRLGMGNTSADHFFSMARPGIARFELKTGIDKHRELIAHVLERSGLPLRQGTFEIHAHNALLTPENAERLLDRLRVDAVSGADDALREQDRWIVSQYHLMLAYPLLSAKEQLEALLAANADDNFLLDLMEVAKPLDESTFTVFLDKACSEENERAQFVVLAFGESTGTPLAPNARKHLASLARCGSERVRTQALGMIATADDKELVEAVAESGWNAANVSRDDGYEPWYGSSVILEAAARGIITHDEALDRISPQFYGRAAKRLGADAAREIARRIDASVKSAAGLEIDFAVPDIEVSQAQDNGAGPSLYLASEKPSASGDPAEAFKRLSESNEAFEDRQKRVAEAFQTFKAELTSAKARIILDNLGIEEFDAVAASHRTLAESWYKLFIELPKARRAAVHNLGVLLAHAFARWDATKAVELFKAFSESSPFVRITFGRAAIPLDAVALWSAQDHPALDELRYARLDAAANDHELARQVLAALWSGKGSRLQEYVGARLRTGRPATMARALMVAGLSERSEFNREVLARYKDTPGVIGQSQAAAMYAYERNAWAEHWFEQMCRTPEPEEFWRYSVLLGKVADGRFDIWASADRQQGEPFKSFWPSVKSKMKRRCKKWQDLREKKLFGGDAPAKIFLTDL